ncbi:hypothetical protein ATE47_03935 [Chryseobacterium sp. IHB B 17019]|uniref:hypothetical protein n=1 Tax=Chryseobacterium sp. IHB B 17019 TaxID=1721091 RepID=UPI00071ED1DA|nr:hypothetical protein [Chryseobacterium sp. IHB B 17019]ALR29721.1 hypothetical protein ATE47_03935 [Chryseobacterium sp. IHB B 17019]
MYSLIEIPNFTHSEDISIFSNYTEISTMTDDFEDKKTILFTKAGIRNFYNLKLGYFFLYSLTEFGASEYEYLGLTFINHNGYSYLQIYTNSQQLNLAKGDRLIILFSDKHKIEMDFKTIGSNSSYSKINTIPLIPSDLEALLNKDIDRIKLISTRKNIFNIYGLNDGSTSKVGNFQYTTKEEGTFLLKYMTYMFISYNLKNPI